MAELGISTPIKGISGFVFFFNVNKMTLLEMIAAPELAFLAPPLAPQAVLIGDGDNRGLGADVTGYLTYIW